MSEETSSIPLANPSFYEDIKKLFLDPIIEAEKNGDYTGITQMFLHDSVVTGKNDAGEEIKYGLVSFDENTSFYVEIDKFSRTLDSVVTGTDYGVFLDNSVHIKKEGSNERLRGILLVVYNKVKNEKMITFVAQTQEEYAKRAKKVDSPEGDQKS